MKKQDKVNRRLNRSSVRAAGIALVSAPLTVGAFQAADAACYAGYCPNASSPVVGGGYNGITICDAYMNGGRGDSGTCVEWRTWYTPFGNVPVSGGNNLTGAAAHNIVCPANTAAIKVPQGYQADNGRYYGGTTEVCVKTDTN